MAIELRSTNVVQAFNRIRDRFIDIRKEEQRWTAGFECLELAIAEFVRGGLIYSDDEILQALSAVGLHVYDKLTAAPPRSWRNLGESVRLLAERMAGAFDPNLNSELAAASELAWKTEEDSRHHYESWGSIIRRLIDSVRLHGKRDPRGYSRFVVGFVAHLPSSLFEGKVHWAVWSLSNPYPELNGE